MHEVNALLSLIKVNSYAPDKFKATLELGEWGALVLCSGFNAAQTELIVNRFVREITTKAYILTKG